MGATALELEQGSLVIMDINFMGQNKFTVVIMDR